MNTIIRVFLKHIHPRTKRVSWDDIEPYKTGYKVHTETEALDLVERTFSVRRFRWLGPAHYEAIDSGGVKDEFKLVSRPPCTGT